jgi:hypothetical protein
VRLRGAAQLKRLALPKDKARSKEGSGSSKPDPRSLVVQLHDHFSFRSHLCLVFEPLGVNLLQLLQQNQCTGLSCSLIRYFSKQLLQASPRPRRPPRSHLPPRRRRRPLEADKERP